MRTRDDVIEYQKTLDDVGTYTKDLKIRDIVSALEFEFRGTNGASGNLDNFISDVITKIEIVDGSEVLYSCNLMELEALHFYKRKSAPVLFPSEWVSTGIQRHSCLLMFGRDLWDPDFAMDFHNFTNPQLKVTSNIAAIRAAGTSGYTTSTLKMSCVAKIMEDLPSPPSKYLMAKQQKAWTSGTAGDNPITLPRDLPYRLAILRAYVAGSDIAEAITNLKVNCDRGKFIPFDRYVKDLDAEALARFGEIRIKHDIYRAHGATIRLLVNTEPHSIPINKASGAVIPLINWEWSSQMYLSLFLHDGTNYSTTQNWTLNEQGHALHATLPILFGDPDRPETWFDPTPYDLIEFTPKEAAAAVCSILLEQPRPL